MQPSYKPKDLNREKDLFPAIVLWSLIFHGLLLLAYGIWSWNQEVPVPKPKEAITFEMVSPPGEAPPSPVPAITNPPAMETPAPEVQPEIAETPDELSNQTEAKVQTKPTPVAQASKSLPSNSNDGLPLPVLKAPANPGGGGNVLGGYKARLQYLVNQAAQQVVADEDMDEDSYALFVFVVQRSGAKTVRLVQSSGSANFDRMALRAMQALDFPPLPTVYEEPSLSVTLRVNPME